MDFNKLSQTQLECLGYYAFPGLSEPRLFRGSTIHALVKKGMLSRIERKDGAFTVYDYEMPINVHIQFCKWCDT
jgi:hypothetical protein